MTVTTGRVEIVKKAISHFLSQTYKNKEMVVVTQGSMENNMQIRQLTESHGIIFVAASQDLTLGAMRNLSIELTTGDVICQWDDDDYYHPERLATQYKFLRCGGIASLYTQHLKLFKNSKKMYWVDYKRGTEDYLEVVEKFPYKRFLNGSIMFRKRYFHEFKNFLYPESGDQSNKEEDLNVLQRLIQIGNVCEVNEGYQYVYVYHGDNTYELKHHEMGLHKKHIFSKEELDCNRHILEETFSFMEIGGFDVCASPVVDFDQPDVKLGEEVAFTISE